jgi:hypothetical protein
MQFSPHKPHNVPKRFVALIPKVCTRADQKAADEQMDRATLPRRTRRGSQQDAQGFVQATMSWLPGKE